MSAPVDEPLLPAAGAPLGADIAQRPGTVRGTSLRRTLATAMVALSGASILRYGGRHGWDTQGFVVAGGAVALCLLYVAGDLYLAERTAARRAERAPLRPSPRLGAAWIVLVWLAWGALTLMAPSFAWCAIPVAFAMLRVLPDAAAATLAVASGVIVSYAWWRVTGQIDPSLLVGPAALAVVVVVTARTLAAETARARRLLVDLTTTRAHLAAAQRRNGRLDERNRVARDLHDSVGQSLTSVTLAVDAAQRALRTDPAKARERLQLALRSSQDALAEVRTVMADLRGGRITEPGRGLVEDLEALAASVPIPGTGALHVHGDLAALDPTTCEALRLSARGLLANVVEHAHATRVDLSLSVIGGTVRLDVVDDGCGFDPGRVGRLPGAAPRGHGLTGLSQRLTTLGGGLTVESGMSGTRVCVHVPLRSG